MLHATLLLFWFITILANALAVIFIKFVVYEGRSSPLSSGDRRKLRRNDTDLYVGGTSRN